jgi:hypothetical protein
MENLKSAEPGRRWSVEAFIAFWNKPEVSRVIGSLTDDIVGYWPRSIGIVRGTQPYVDVIAAMMRVCPDFSLRVPEYATTGNYAFIRWIATGTGPDGRFEFTGCDRVQIRDGHVCENYVFCDNPFFEKVAAEIARARRHEPIARGELAKT